MFLHDSSIKSWPSRHPSPPRKNVIPDPDPGRKFRLMVYSARGSGIAEQDSGSPLRGARHGGAAGNTGVATTTIEYRSET